MPPMLSIMATGTDNLPTITSKVMDLKSLLVNKPYHVTMIKIWMNIWTDVYKNVTI